MSLRPEVAALDPGSLLAAARWALDEGSTDAAAKLLGAYQELRRAGAVEPTGITRGDEIAHLLNVRLRRMLFRVLPGGRP